jgi:glycosyltransferase involved in cell wall biosynthesis
VVPVASDVGGNTEIVGHDVHGLVFQSGDEAALAGHLARLAREPQTRARLAVAAREHVRATFGMQAMIERYEALYERVCAAGTR